MVLRPTNGLSLCAGGGGLDMGLGLAEPGFHTRAYVEWEEYPRQTIIAAQQAGYFAPAPIWDDVTTFDGKPLRGAIDTILAGYPCQPFSHAGQRKGEKDERHLWPDIARIIAEIEPKWVFLENVPGHVTLGAETVLRELWDMGFTPAAGLFSAQETGAAHERLRWYCVAYRDSDNGCANGGSPDAGANGRNFACRDSADVENAGRAQRRESEPTGDVANGKNARWVKEASRSGKSGENVGNAKFQSAKLQRMPRIVLSEDGENSGVRAQANGCEFRAASAELANAAIKLHECREAGAAEFGQHSSHGGKLANSSGTRSPFGRAEPHTGKQGQSVEPINNCRPLHAPGPTDADAWANVLADSPKFAPALSLDEVIRHARGLGRDPAWSHKITSEPNLRRMAYGLARRSRALRLLGNGVCPVAAANAWVALSNAHGLSRLDLEATSAGAGATDHSPIGDVLA